MGTWNKHKTKQKGRLCGILSVYNLQACCSGQGCLLKHQEAGLPAWGRDGLEGEVGAVGMRAWACVLTYGTQKISGPLGISSWASQLHSTNKGK